MDNMHLPIFCGTFDSFFYGGSYFQRILVHGTYLFGRVRVCYVNFLKGTHCAKASTTGSTNSALRILGLVFCGACI